MRGIVVDGASVTSGSRRRALKGTTPPVLHTFSTDDVHARLPGNLVDDPG